MLRASAAAGFGRSRIAGSFGASYECPCFAPDFFRMAMTSG